MACADQITAPWPEWPVLPMVKGMFLSCSEQRMPKAKATTNKQEKARTKQKQMYLHIYIHIYVYIYIYICTGI